MPLLCRVTTEAQGSTKLTVRGLYAVIPLLMNDAFVAGMQTKTSHLRAPNSFH